MSNSIGHRFLLHSYRGLLLFMLLWSAGAIAQSNPNEEQGLKPYDSFHGGDLDSVSLTNGGLSLHIPLASFPQRGNLDLSFFVSFSNKQWYVKPPRLDSQGHVITPAQWLPMPNTGVQIVSSADWWMDTSFAIEPQDPNIQGQTLYDWSQSVSSPDGSTHLFGDQIASFNPPLYPMRSLDATGLLRPDAQTLTLPNGTRFSYPTLTGLEMTSPFGHIRGGKQASSVTDANGNQITIGTTGWTDTMGRFIPGSASTAVQGIQPGAPTTDLSKCPSGTTSALIWSVPGVASINGGVRTFYFCYTSLPLSTNFDVNTTGGVHNYGPVNTPLLTAVILPDLTAWTFTYDNFGDVLHVGFPTGGSLTYTYGTGPLSASTGTGFSTWIMSRTVDASDGTGGHQWTYSYQGNFSTGFGTGIFSYAVKGVATVTNPDGNDVVHTIGPGASGTGCPGYEYQAQYFQGRASSGALLKTVQTQYDCTAGTPGGDLDGTSLNAVPTQVTTTLKSGRASHSVSAYDTVFNDPNGQATRIGSLLQTDEYDFSAALARSTINHYLWQDNATYKAGNFVALPVSTTLKNSAGTQVAQKLFGYDQTAVVSSGIGSPTHLGPPAGEPYRGNLTSISHWRDTTNSLVSSTATYFDTGMKATSADPLHHATTYAYSSTFMGAYLTQTNKPDTQMPDTGAPIVHHIASADYDSNSGLLTRYTDENAQNFSYHYDLMLRLQEADHPDGGQANFTYPDSNTVERKRLIAGTSFDDYKIKFDGLGRPVQTLKLTPDCASFIKSDTVYDTTGRVASISNPYCLTSDSTYGITQTQYDALSRATQVIKQDQSFSSVIYDDVPGDTSGAPLTCTTAVDEAGKKRQFCTDALGQLVKVIEPNPGATATNGSGWVTVSGAEQSAQSQQATSASVTVTIGGADGRNVNSVQVCSGPPLHPTCHTITTNLADGGTIGFSVNAGGTILSSSTTYNGSSTTANLATTLFNGFPASSLVTIGNPNGGSALTLTAAPGSAGNSYTITTTLQSGCVPSDTLSCGAQGWTMTLSGPGLAPTTATTANFTGGQNGSNTSDAGTVTVTVNGTGYSTNFGNGDTSSMIAGRLAGLISSGSYATASASGSTINLTSKTPGTAGNYTLGTSFTWNSAQFTNPSFTAASSGSLSGGLDGSALNNHPYVTTYQYNPRGDLLCVHQKAADATADVACTGTTPPSVPAAWRQRFFTYDSLSHILTAMNPETNGTGTSQFTFAYDDDGRMISKVRPAPNQAWGSSALVTTSFTYDNLDRLLDTTYSDGVTPSSSHRYDYSAYLGQSFANPVGREVAATTSNASQYFTSYDAMGRIANTVQCNPGISGCKTFAASYDKMGDITNLAYPANAFSVTYGYDSAARLASASDSNGVTYATTATNSYFPGGALREFTSPNFNNLKYHAELNNRLQPIEIWVGSSSGAAALFDKQYQYNPQGLSQSNNGNIYTITNVKDSTRTQTFTYDALNRLLSAGDNGHWSNSYVYDPWGNLYQKNPGSPAGENMVKVADTNNHLSGMTYDAAGNVINDGLGGTYVSDAENRIVNANGTIYVYDANGRRIQKSGGTNYWYGPSGQVFAETDSAGNWANYIFFGAQRLARNVPQPAPNPPDIKYFISDHLHSTAMFVDKAGTSAAILDDNDFYPWGGVIPGIGKSSSNDTLKYEGKYRDPESNLDYFGARYYANITGRFTSADWSAAPTAVPYASFGDPQSLNLYAFVGNNPISRVDADGHDYVFAPFQSFNDDDGGSNIESTHNHMFTINLTTTIIHLPSLDGTTPGPTVTHYDWTVTQVGVPGSVSGSATTVTPGGGQGCACSAQARSKIVGVPPGRLHLLKQFLMYLFDVKHLFWTVRGSDGVEYDLSAGPGPAGNCPSGMLCAFKTATSTSQEQAYRDGGKVFYTAAQTSDLCSRVDAMEKAVDNWPLNITYNFRGPNSNGAFNQIGQQGGMPLLSPFWTPGAKLLPF
jgi:RHS repeat-associated protein